MEFSTIIKGLVEQNSRQAIRQGEITAITNDSGTYYLTVKISGDTTTISKVRYSSSLTPRVGQIVFLQINGNDIYAIDELAGADKTLAVRAERTTNQSIPDSANTAITFDTDNSDLWGVWNSGNATRLTVPIAGRYVAIGQLHFAAADNGIRRAIIRQDGSTDLAEQDIVVRNTTVAGATYTAYAVKLNVMTLPFTLAANAYIELIAFQNSGGAIDVVGTSNPKPSLSLIYLGP
jgi:hypothetical protein